MTQTIFIPPPYAIEVQPYQKKRSVGLGIAPVAGQSRIVVADGLAYISVGKLWAIIDAQDVGLISGRTWSARVKKRNIYATNEFRRKGCSRVRTHLHRLIVGCQTSELVDHADCNGLNNMRSNLRICTKAQNNKNLRTPVTNKSGIKGVHFVKRNGRWRAEISNNNKAIYLGYFDTAEEARAAYLAASLKHHGDFGRAS